MESYRRERKSNFTYDEVCIIVASAEKNKEIITNKSIDSDMNSKKHMVWKDVADTLNRYNPMVQRTAEDLRRKWKNLTRAVRKEYGEATSHDTPYRPHISPISMQVMEILLSGDNRQDTHTPDYTVSPDTSTETPVQCNEEEIEYKYSNFLNTETKENDKTDEKKSDNAIENDEALPPKQNGTNTSEPGDRQCEVTIADVQGCSHDDQSKEALVHQDEDIATHEDTEAIDLSPTLNQQQQIRQLHQSIYRSQPPFNFSLPTVPQYPINQLPPKRRISQPIENGEWKKPRLTMVHKPVITYTPTDESDHSFNQRYSSPHSRYFRAATSGLSRSRMVTTKFNGHAPHNKSLDPSATFMCLNGGQQNVPLPNMPPLSLGHTQTPQNRSMSSWQSDEKGALEKELLLLKREKILLENQKLMLEVEWWKQKLNK